MNLGMAHHCGSEDITRYTCPEHDWLLVSFCNGCGEPYRWAEKCEDCDFSIEDQGGGKRA